MPSVEGARTPSKATAIPACRNRSTSSMRSAPAIIPPNSDITFAPAFAPATVLRAHDPHPVTHQTRQIEALGQRDNRDQPRIRYQVRIIKRDINATAA